MKDIIAAKNATITNLEDHVKKVVRRNVELADQLASTQHELGTAKEEFSIKIDDLEQYGRKQSLRIEGIEVVPGETNTLLAKNVVSALNELGADVKEADFVRLHRSGRSYTDRAGKRVAQTIVRFNAWAPRHRAFATRYIGTKEQREKRPFYVRHDLTKRRHNLLAKAQHALDDHPYMHYYADGECNLVIMNRDSKVKTYFNTERELADVINGAAASDALVGSRFSDVGMGAETLIDNHDD